MHRTTAPSARQAAGEARARSKRRRTRTPSLFPLPKNSNFKLTKKKTSSPPIAPSPLQPPPAKQPTMTPPPQRAPSSTARAPTRPSPRSSPTPRAAASSTSSRRSSATTRRTTSARRRTRCRTGAFWLPCLLLLMLSRCLGLWRSRAPPHNHDCARRAPALPRAPPRLTPAERALPPPPRKTQNQNDTNNNHSQQLNKDTRQLSVDLVDVKMFDGLLGATLEERPTDLLPLVRRRPRPLSPSPLPLAPQNSPKRPREKKTTHPPHQPPHPLPNTNKKTHKQKNPTKNSSRSPRARSSRRTTSWGPTAGRSASATCRSC